MHRIGDVPGVAALDYDAEGASSSPAYILAEIKMKRQIIEECAEWIDIGEIQPGTTWNDDAAGMALGMKILRIMATVYLERNNIPVQS